MAKVKITYNRDQLRGFTIAELKSLDLYKRAKLDKDVKKKADIIKGMLAQQKSEKPVSKPKAKSKPKATTAPKAVNKPIPVKIKPEVEKIKKVNVVFHRFVRKTNRHLH